MSKGSADPPIIDQLEALLDIAHDLTASLAGRDRSERLLTAVRRILPCDAACLLRLEGENLIPLAAHGLAPEAIAQVYDRRQHPRLDVILRSSDPVIFPPDSPLADPFDGFLATDPEANLTIHACLGWALSDGDRVVGALTADALRPGAFDEVDPRVLRTLGALAGAALKTTALIEAIERRAERSGAVVQALQSAALTEGNIVGSSEPIRRLHEEIDTVADSDLPVLVLGETGVGKELVVHAIHRSGARRDSPLIQVNCAALPESIAESELFGSVAGAYTGSSRDRAGKFEVADGGTLFLDEVGELPLSVQPKLLRVLQHGEIQRIGSDRSHRVDVRVVAATNRELEAEVERGDFRADLYHRLAVYPVRVPPLRDRRADIPLLAAHFVASSRRRLGLGPLRLTEDAKRRLSNADWPGNVRELENVVSRAVLRRGSGHRGGEPLLLRADDVDVRAAATALEEASLPVSPTAPDAVQHSSSLRERVDEFQRAVILQALEDNDGVWAAAARSLGTHRSNLHRLAHRLGLASRP